MAKLPTRDSLGAVPSVQPRRGIASIAPSVPDMAVRSSPLVGRGIADLGGGIAAIGKAAEAFQQHELKQQEFETERKFQEFEWSTQRELDERMRQVQPGQTREFADQWQKDYVENGKKFFSDVPDQFKAHYERRLFDVERKLYGSATTFARTEQKRFSTNSISDTTENVYRPRARITPTEELGAVASDYDRLVDTNPDLTPVERDELKRQGRAKIALAHIEGLPPDQAKRVLAAGSTQAVGDAVADRIVKVESRGDPNAQNPNSSAFGAGQFIKSTWLSLIKETRPDIASGKTDAEILQLRGDKDLSRDMVKEYGNRNAKFLRDNGLEPNAANVYLAHFLGPDGARKVLTASPDTPVSELVDKNAIDANRSVLEGRTAGAVQAWATNKMGRIGKTSEVLDALPFETRNQLMKKADADIIKITSEASASRAEQIERQIIDASSNPAATLPPRATIESDPSLKEPARNALLRAHDTAAKDAVKLQAGLAKFADPNAGTFNPYDKDDKAVVDKIYKSFGGNENPAALGTVVRRSGVLPPTASAKLRGDIISNDPARVGASLTTAANLLVTNPNIFATVEGKNDIENNAVAFRHYVDDLGMSAEDAAKRIIRDQSPEYQAGVKAKLKTEDIDTKLKKELSINDLAGAFDESWLPFTNPNVGFDPGTRQGMYAQYAEQVKERYLENGDWSLAKKQAANDLKKTWGVTSVNGKSVVMQYPPERAPVYAGIENASEAIAGHAVEIVKAEFGADIDRASIRLQPIPGATAAAYKAGRPPPYMLMWTDKAGTVHMLNPGKAFVADPQALRGAQTDKRRKGFEAGVETSIANQPTLETSAYGAP